VEDSPHLYSGSVCLRASVPDVLGVVVDIPKHKARLLRLFALGWVPRRLLLFMTNLIYLGAGLCSLTPHNSFPLETPPWCTGRSYGTQSLDHHERHSVLPEPPRYSGKILFWLVAICAQAVEKTPPHVLSPRGGCLSHMCQQAPSTATAEDVEDGLYLLVCGDRDATRVRQYDGRNGVATGDGFQAPPTKPLHSGRGSVAGVHPLGSSPILLLLGRSDLSYGHATVDRLLYSPNLFA
jgi:hypothetical protein